MKKRIIAIAIITTGLVAVPTLVSAQHRSVDTITGTTGVHQEDKQQDRTSSTTSTESMVTIPNQTTPVQVETENSATGATITIEAAVTQAFTVFPDKTVTKVELEHEDGVLVYSIRFSDGSRVDINAMDGTIVSTRDFTNHDNRDNEHRQSDNHQKSDDSKHNNSGSVSGRNHTEDN